MYTVAYCEVGKWEDGEVMVYKEVSEVLRNCLKDLRIEQCALGLAEHFGLLVTLRLSLYVSLLSCSITHPFLCPLVMQTPFSSAFVI